MNKNSNEFVKIELCKILNRIGAVQFGAFKLTSGKMSPYYVDLRIVPSFPDAFRKISNFQVQFVRKEIGDKNFDRIVGIPVAGIPFAALTAYDFGKPFLYTRKGIRLHGRQRRIEGVLAPGDRVLLIDDLITTGLSLEKAARAITAEGGIVADAAVLIDRQEGGRKRLEKRGIKLHALLSISEIASTLAELGTIDEEQKKTILKQIKKE
ncbi:MAG: orotate phosphoribosyltransferase [Candidatus Bathyarchaeia archaeon]|jgi:orotate phosphoribosyltransferase